MKMAVAGRKNMEVTGALLVCMGDICKSNEYAIPQNSRYSLIVRGKKHRVRNPYFL